MVGCSSTERIWFCKQEKEPHGFLRAVKRNLSMVSITIAAGGVESQRNTVILQVLSSLAWETWVTLVTTIN